MESKSKKIAPSVGFIGSGNMAQALIAGLLRTGFLGDSIFCSDSSADQRKKIRKILKVQTVSSNQELVQKCKFVFLATKPQDLKVVFNEIDSINLKNKIIISIAAGVTLSSLRKGLRQHEGVVRAMPNQPARIGEGITGLCTDFVLSPAKKKEVEKLFKGSGAIVWVQKESDLDSVTALSGSGPAFVYRFIEGLAQAGVKLGLSLEQASLLALQTTLGSSLQLKHEKIPARELIEKVTSKGGTTQAGLEVLDQYKFEKMLEDTLKRAKKRAEELSKMLEKDLLKL